VEFEHIQVGCLRMMHELLLAVEGGCVNMSGSTATVHRGFRIFSRSFECCGRGHGHRDCGIEL